MSFVGGVGVINCDLIFGGIERLPRLGEELYAKSFALRMGGGVPSIMIGLSRLNVPVKLCTSLGKNDLFSRFTRDELERSGAEYHNLYQGEGIPLVVTAVAVTPEDRTFLSSSPDELSDPKLPEKIYQLLRGASIVRMNGSEALRDVYAQLKREGAKLVFDTGWSEDMSVKNYERQLRLADYYLPNRAEALKMTGQSDVREAARVLSGYLEQTVIKLDAQGCLLLDREGLRCVGVLPDTISVDPTGAGDAFCTGFIYGLYHGHSFDDCVRMGSVMGGLCVRAYGCVERWVKEEELLKLYKTISPIALWG